MVFTTKARRTRRVAESLRNKPSTQNCRISTNPFYSLFLILRALRDFVVHFYIAVVARLYCCPMKNALIVSRTKKSVAFFTEMLNAASVQSPFALESADAARRLLGERDIDLVIVDSPLQDESGEDLARYVASRDVSQVIFVVPGEHVDAVGAVCENDGVLVLARPLNKSVFWSALKLAGAAQRRLKRLQSENDKLKRQIEDLRIIHRAKCLLIFYHKINEQQAHRLIEKRAMDRRSTRRAIAEEILKTYENFSGTK